MTWAERNYTVYGETKRFPLLNLKKWVRVTLPVRQLYWYSEFQKYYEVYWSPRVLSFMEKKLSQTPILKRKNVQELLDEA